MKNLFLNINLKYCQTQMIFLLIFFFTISQAENNNLFEYEMKINTGITMPDKHLSDTLNKFAYTFLPSQHLMPILSANSTAHRISIFKITENGCYIASMGGVFPLASASYKKRIFQLSIASSLYTQLLKSPGHLEVINADFFADIYFDIAVSKNIIIRFGKGHTSQHLVDDAIEILNYTKSINYVRDYYSLFCMYKSDALKGNFYIGTYYNYNFKIPYDISNTMIYEAGIENSPIRLLKSTFIFWGLDIKLRGELNYGTSQNYQLGIKYDNLYGRTIRFAVNHRAGFEERGQFYNQKNKFNSIGIYFDF